MINIKKGDEVVITDYPFGHKTKTTGVIVGVLDDDYFNVLVKTGLTEGRIIKHKYWRLQKID